ncbi:MAG: hypothetical protein ACSHXK_15440 [Oceanococcus sp.]
MLARIWLGAVLLILSACAQENQGQIAAYDTTRAGDELELSAPVKIILDTDFKDDVDDVGALAVLHALADLGEAEILAVMVSTLSPCGGTAVDVINSYYARPDIPIGLRLPLDDECSALAIDPRADLNQRYPQLLTDNYPHDLDVQQAPSAPQLYCDVLAEQPDNSVVIAAVGFLPNLAALLTYDCPGHELSGLELIQSKVQRLEVMGGMYPAGFEFNFSADFPEYFERLANLDPAVFFTSANDVMENWPGRIVFNGFEVGLTVQTGATLFTDTPEGNPVREAYRVYVGENGTRPSWDPITVWTSVRGVTDLFVETGQDGRNQGLIFGGNVWVPDPQNEKEHSYLLKTAEDADIAALLDGLMALGPLHAAAKERNHGE